MSAVLAQNWWAVALRGVFAILFGLIALLLPGATILSLVWFFAAYMLVDGVFGIVSAVKAASNNQRWGLLVLEGVVNIAVGVIAFLWPGLTVVFFVTLMGFWSLVTGILMIVAAFKLNPALRPRLADLQRRRLGPVRHRAPRRPAGRRRGADLVARRLRAGLRHHAAGARLQAQEPQGQRAADAFRPGCLMKKGRPATALFLLHGDIQPLLSLSSGDHVGSDAKDGVWIGCSTRPVMSTM